jgi:5-methylcytosine-specific restriction endonuclease McrA
VKAVKVADVDTVIHNIIDSVTIDDNKSIVAESMRPLLDLAKTIPEIAIRDEHRYLETTYMSKKQRQDPEKYKTLKPKINYVKALNELNHDTTGIHIKCFCCRDVIDMNNAGCHRSHDIPRSDGGDASRDNIYLCCATCNQAMGDCMSVIDYKTELYVKALDAMPLQSIPVAE